MFKRKIISILCLTFFGLFAFFISIKSNNGNDDNTNLLESKSIDLATGGSNKELKLISKNIVLSSLDHEKLQQEAILLESERIYRFAYPREVDVTPESHGQWTEMGDNLNWNLSLKSKGAESINLGFTDFFLPEGAVLDIMGQSIDAKPITFTSADNDKHGQLWTPLFWASGLTVNLKIPRSKKAEAKLHLTKINHGFRSSGSRFKIAANTSGTCEIDVVCSVEDNSDYGPIIDIYRDQIKSVGAYTLQGIDTCSGALINNTRNDLKPFFLTAEHCGITSSNAASIVVYWNYENSICRAVGSSLNGQVGDGRTDQFNSGSILRAKNAASDFCLIELDDPVNPEYMPFFAGWNRASDSPDTSVGIHHPGVSEKRISIELQPTTITDWLSDTTDVNADYIRISGWDFGVNEPGSSGSPLFDDGGLIVGQLTGGYSDCQGTNGPDYYGRFYSSWTGGGTPGTRLSDWLDPIGSGVESLEGIYADDLVYINGIEVIEADSGIINAELNLQVRNPSGEAISVRVHTEDQTAKVSDSDYIGFDKVIEFKEGEVEQFIEVQIVGDLKPEEHESFLVHLSDPSNALVSSVPGKITILNNDYITPEIISDSTHQTFTNQEFTYQVVSLNTPTEYKIEDGEIGMFIDEKTGEFTWNPTSPGVFDATIIALNPAGSQRQQILIEVALNSIANGIDLTSSKLKEKKYVDYQSVGKFIIPKNGDNYENWNQFGSEYNDSTWITSPQPYGSRLSLPFLNKLLRTDISENLSALNSSIYFRFPFEVDFNFESIESAQLNLRVKDGFVAYLNGEKIASINAPADLNSESSALSEIEESELEEEEIFEINNSLLLPGENLLAVHAMTHMDYNFSQNEDNKANSKFSRNIPIKIDDDLNSDLGSVSNSIRNIPIRSNDSSSVSVRLNNLNVSNIDPSSFFLSAEINAKYRKPSPAVVNEGWSWQQSISHDGVDAIQTDSLGNNESAILTIKARGPDILYYWWKVSSESGYDYLRFLVNGEEVYKISGEVGWQNKKFNLPVGEHELQWIYSKDGGSSGGLDRAWVDEVTFASQAGAPKIVSKLKKTVIVGNHFSYQILSTDSNAKCSVSSLPDGVVFDGNDIISGIPTAVGDYDITITADNGELSTSELKLKVIDSIDLAVQSSNGTSEKIEPIKEGSGIKYLVPENDSLGLSWIASSLDFDDSLWKNAAQPIGYDSIGVNLIPFINTNLQNEIKGVNSSVYLRMPFDLDLEGKSVLYGKLELKYDDGYVAYLNGNELSRENAPEDLDFSSRATRVRNDNQVITGPSVVQLVPDMLVNGENILAIHALNISSGSSDFLVDAKLESIVAEDLPSQILGNWEASGDEFWFPQFEHSKDGVSAAQSGEIGNNQQSTTSLLVTGPATVSFWWKVSCEDYSDYLTFRVDNQIIDRTTGKTNWEQVTFEVAEGEHILSWDYSKDSFGSEGLDAGWVDGLTIVEGLAPKILSDRKTVWELGSEVDIPVEIINEPESYGFENLPNWLVFDEAAGSLIGVANSVGEFNFDIWAENSTGRNLVSIQLIVAPPLSDALDFYGFSTSRDLVINDSTTLKYLVPPDESFSDQWKAEDFDDSSWIISSQPLGFENANGTLEQYITSNIADQMKGVNSSGFFRYDFDIDKPIEDIISLKLSTRIDDGYVAHLNGVELISFNAPEILKFDSSATSSRQDLNVITDPISTFINKDLLLEGRNVIAIQGMNRSLGSSDFFLDTELEIISKKEALGEAVAWVSSGDAIWRPQTKESYDGEDAVRSGEIGNSERSTFSTTISGPATISFWWKVSSEEFSDYLRVRLFSSDDNQNIFSDFISGEVNWTKVEVEVPEGQHTIEWTYSKDGFARFGQDAGWVDMISYEPGLKPKIEINPNLTFYLGDEIEIPLLITRSHDVMGFEGLPEWLTYDQSKQAIVGVASQIEELEFEVWAENTTGRSSTSVMIRISPSVNDALDFYGINSIPVDLIGNESELKYFIPVNNELDNDWVLDADQFDDSTWEVVNQPVGFESPNGALEPYISTDISSSMKGVNSSGYFRYVFNVDLADMTMVASQLEVMVDDGYIAYLNGVEVGNANVPESVNYNSRATVSRNDSSVISNRYTNEISTDLFKDGENIIAVQAMNRTALSSDFILGLNLNGIMIDPEDDTSKLKWEGAGEQPWFSQTDITNDGQDAVQSGDIGANDFSQLSTIISGPAMVSFWWKVSSESFSDYLRVRVSSLNDNQNIFSESISGEVDWSIIEFEVPEGQHLIEWTYSKDSSVESGRDAGWIDQFEVISGLAPRIEIESNYNVFSGSTFKLPLNFINEPESFGFDNLPDWLVHDLEEGALVGVPNDEGSFEFTIWAVNASGRFEKTVNVSVVGPISDALDSLGIPLEKVHLIDIDSIPKYIIPVDDSLGMEWIGSTEIFDDSSWSEAIQPLGFESPGGKLEQQIRTNIGAQMKGVNSGGYFRYIFDFDGDLNNLINPSLELMIDDGYVAYLNGIEVGRQNVSDEIQFNSRATVSRDDNSVITNFYTEELPSDLFKVGENVLAIHAMNRTKNSSDFILGLQLLANVAEDDEGSINGNWEGTGESEWYSQNTINYDGIDAAQSGRINAWESSTISTTIDGPASVSFWWKVSSEENFDYLSFLVDGAVVERISGEVNWLKFNYDISAGSHTLSWTYSKDGAADSGRDAGWLDQVVIASLSNYTPNTVSSGDMIFDVEWVNVSDRNDVLRMDVLFPEESIENPPQVSFEPVQGCILTIYDDVNNETSRFVTPVLNFSSTEPLNYNEDLVGQSGFTDFNLIDVGDYSGFNFFMMRERSTGKEFTLKSMILRNQKEDNAPLQVIKSRDGLISLVLRVPSNAQRVRIMKSNDLLIWEPSLLITDENQEWTPKPTEGWPERQSFSLSDDLLEEDRFFFRLEFQE